MTDWTDDPPTPPWPDGSFCSLPRPFSEHRPSLSARDGYTPPRSPFEGGPLPPSPADPDAYHGWWYPGWTTGGSQL